MGAPDRSHRAAILAGVALLTVAFIHTAWLCDDAYITLRTVDNFTNGYGLRWNIVERVQSFTHPAWLFVITPFYVLTGEAFYTVLGLQVALAMATAWLLLRRFTTSAPDALLAAAALVGSKAFVDFSTSGLENTLVHLMLVVFLFVWLRADSTPRRWTGLGLLTSGLLLCRLDLGVLVAPLLAVALWPLVRRRILLLALGLAPFLAWEAFSVVYYGQLIPNTALAKLPPGVPLAALVAQGLKYFAATFHFDPFTILVLATCIVALLKLGGQRGRLVAIGVSMHLIYVVFVGGDFMSGRFLTPAFVLALAGVLAFVRIPGAPMVRASAAGALLVIALLNPAAPLRTGEHFGVGDPPVGEFARFGVTDERKFYYPSLGFLRVWYGVTSPAMQDGAAFGLARRELALKEGTDALIASSVGLAGYYAGPAVHIIDRNGLADPLLARLPPEPDWRIGHFVRAVPAGYLESCKTNENLIEDPAVKATYDDVRLLTRAPVWTAARLRLILTGGPRR